MNQNSKQLARGLIDDQLTACGWILQDKKSFNRAAGISATVRGYQIDAGPADYILFVNLRLVELIEAKPKEGVRFAIVKEQSTEFASVNIKCVNNDPLAFVGGGEISVRVERIKRKLHTAQSVNDFNIEEQLIKSNDWDAIDKTFKNILI